MADLCLVINLGSSSLKAALVDSTGAFLWHEGRSLSKDDVLEEVLDSWLTPAIAPHRQRLERIGHRVVHGGERFTAPTLITPEVERRLKELIPMAPLHNPPALKGLAWARQRAPECPQWACFDTAFHSSLPAAATTYAIPQPFRAQGFRRFGFHGINHQHVAESVAEQWRQQDRDPAQLRLISAHLGAGASLAAIKGGICIDTMYRPHTLACGHVFCEPCVRKAKETRTMAVCPVCRSATLTTATPAPQTRQVLLTRCPARYDERRNEVQLAEQRRAAERQSAFHYAQLIA